MKPLKTEAEVFHELKILCTSIGYIHAIAFFSFRDNVYYYEQQLTPEDIVKLHSRDRLIRSEISTLIGLMVQQNIDFTIPKSDILSEYISKTETLLEELQQSMFLPASNIFKDIIQNKKDENPLSQGVFLRESIFYGGDSAYDFQYLDLSIKKYQNDDAWFNANKGFYVNDVRNVIDAITDLHYKKLYAFKGKLLKSNPYDWSCLELFSFSVNEIYEHTSLDKEKILRILCAFSIALEQKNETFKSLGDFNLSNAYPLIQINDNNFLLLQNYSLLEAFYETPFYWFNEDDSYKNIAMENRGKFTEAFSFEILKKVFGENNVYKNVNIYDKKKIVGEIDVLVVFANRVIILQAKSKKLTLDARKGNDNALSSDFKKAIQDSYEQGSECAAFLQNDQYNLVDANNTKISIRNDFKEIYLFCVVSDHYPSLAFQVDQFLKYDQSDIVKPPFVMDIFLLDVMAEMLSNPLHFLSYVSKRTTYFKKINAQHELIILSYHLKKNLFLTDKFTMIMLDESISADLDQAILVRRKGIEGIDTPEGILTKFQGTFIGNFIDSINGFEDDYTIEIGFFLLMLSEEAIEQINSGIQKMMDLFVVDDKNHDFSIGFDDISTGLTIHCNDYLYKDAFTLLLDHCKYRKYRQKANNWFGLCFDPILEKVKFGIMSDKKWSYSKNMGKEVLDRLSSRKIKIGRNDECPCGSGKKYKKCCWGK